jgi:hypothetical protein
MNIGFILHAMKVVFKRLKLAGCVRYAFDNVWGKANDWDHKSAITGGSMYAILVLCTPW